MIKPAQYYHTIDLTGDAIFPILDKSWNVNSIRIYSSFVDNDLLALEYLQKNIDTITSAMQIKDWDGIKEAVDYNPDYFPSLKAGKDLSETVRQKEEAELQEDVISESLEEGKIAIMVTTTFDPEGDNVSSRWVLESKGFKIEGKVLTEVNDYLEQKANKKLEFKESFLCFKTPDNTEDILYN